MKYVIFLGDGMADRPLESLGNKTPLQAADKPMIDTLAKGGRCGLFKTLPEGLPTGSAVANLSVLGYDPKDCFEGRGVLEAASMGVDIGEDDVAMRCNLICVENGRIKNHSAGHISSEEAKIIIEDLQKELGSDKVSFHPGVSYRHLFVLHGNEFSKNVDCKPPHDIPGTGEQTVDIEGDEFTTNYIYNVAEKAAEILKDHPVNKKRIEQGKDPATNIWLWSPGKRPKMEKFKDKYGKTGAVISAVDLIQGLGVYAGFDVIKVEGATGLYDTNYEGKADAVVEALKTHDFVYCHVEASDEAGHEGDEILKTKTIEYLDHRLISRAMESLGKDVAIAVLPDHATPCAIKTHTTEPIPFIIFKPGEVPDKVEKYDEESCKKGSYGVIEGEEFIKAFFS